MTDQVSVEDLKELWNAGAIDLPTVAGQYSSAAEKLHDTRYHDAAFDTSNGGKSPLYETYDELRSMFQDKVLVKSSENCEAAGKVLTQIADSFATQDHLNSEDIDEYKEFKDLDERPEYEQPPGVPDAPTSDQPLANPQA